MKIVYFFDGSESDSLEAAEGQILGICGQGHSHFLYFLSDFKDSEHHSLVVSPLQIKQR